MYRKQHLDVITWGDLNLTCGEGVTELQNLTNLHLLFFAESHQMQQKNFEVSPYHGMNHLDVGHKMKVYTSRPREFENCDF